MLHIENRLVLTKIFLSLIMPGEESDKSVRDTSWPKGDEAVGAERNGILVSSAFISFCIFCS